MHHRQSHPRKWNLFLAAACVAVIASACAGDSKKSNDGSISVGAGGSSPSGSGGSGVTGQGGSSVTAIDAAATSSTSDAGGSSVAVIACAKDTDCPSAYVCRGGVCASPKACNVSLDCGSTDLVCDPSRGFCVQCAKAADCATGQDCVANQCVTATKCQTSIDCGTGKVCDPAGQCVECVSNADCSATQHCVQNVCRTACESDKTCTPQNMLCSSSLTVCVQCSAQLPCAAGTYCDNYGQCKAAVCAVGDSMCSGNGVAQCKADGSGWGAVNNCPAAKPCKAFGGVAACGGPVAGIDGGVAIDGGSGIVFGSTTTIDGGWAACNPAAEAPCTSIPKLSGAINLDGNGDDFCDVPSFHLNADVAKLAGRVNVYNATPPEDAVVRVAWTPAGLAVYVDVTDASVQTVNEVDSGQAITKSYQGDSIELFVASSNSANGAPGSDPNTLHVIIPADGPAVSVKTTNSSGTSTGTPEKWAASQYRQIRTTTGYAIEALLPWQGGNPSTGAQVRFDIALNSADSNFGGVDDMRDGQLVYYVGQVSSSSCQGSSDGTVPYCDDRTWCASTLQ